MVVIIGCIVVTGSVIGGFLWAGGDVMALNQPSEFVTIGGASLGALIVMSPFPVLKGIVTGIIQALKGAPYSKKSYEDTFSALYELFRIVVQTVGSVPGADVPSLQPASQSDKSNRGR